MGVARPQFANEPAVFQPLPRPAALDGCPERRFVHRGIDIGIGRLWRAGGVQHQLQRGEDQVQSGFRLTPKRAPAFVKRMAGAPTHPDEVLAMHLDEMVEERFLRVDEEARHEGLPLGGRKALQVFRIVVGPQLCTPGHGSGRDPPEGNGPHTQGAEELFPLQIGQERGRGRLRRIGLQGKQR